MSASPTTSETSVIRTLTIAAVLFFIATIVLGLGWLSVPTVSILSVGLLIWIAYRFSALSDLAQNRKEPS